VVCALWSLRASGAAGCRCKVLVQGAVELAYRFRRVPLQGVAAEFMLLQGAAVRVLCALWS